MYFHLIQHHLDEQYLSVELHLSLQDLMISYLPPISRVSQFQFNEDEMMKGTY